MHKTVTNHSNNIIKKYYCIRKHNNANQFFKINNLAEPIFLFKMGLSYLISKLFDFKHEIVISISQDGELFKRCDFIVIEKSVTNCDLL